MQACIMCQTIAFLFRKLFEITKTIYSHSQIQFLKQNTFLTYYILEHWKRYLIDMYLKTYSKKL
jgi:hypothetical protein